MESKRFLWIIIPVFNRCEMTRQCLQSLMRSTYRDYSVIIVDDGSTDGTGKMLRDEFPEAVVLKGDGSFFWTKSINMGVKHVLEQCSPEDYILTLNNDLVVEEGYLQNLVECAQKNPGTLIGSVSVDRATKRIADGGVLIDWWRAKFTVLRRGEEYDMIRRSEEPCPVDVLAGRGTLIPAKVFPRIGLYDEKALPQYLADYELSVRAKRKGYGLLMDYRSPVFNSVRATGLNDLTSKRSWGQWIKSFFNLKSSTALRYRWRFARACCPGFFQACVFFAFDLFRVVGTSLRYHLFGKQSSQWDQ